MSDLPEWALRKAEVLTAKVAVFGRTYTICLPEQLACALVAARRAGREEMRERAAKLVDGRTTGKLKNIFFGPEARFDPAGCTEIADQISRALLNGAAQGIRALPLDEEPTDAR